MTAKEQLNEMKKFIQITEGSWALPKTAEDFDRLAAILNSGKNNAAIQEEIYNVLGDDTLFDRLDKLDSQEFDAPEIITQWMQDQRRDKYSNFPNIWNTFQLSQRHDSPMNNKKIGTQQSREPSDLQLDGVVEDLGASEDLSNLNGPFNVGDSVRVNNPGDEFNYFRGKVLRVDRKNRMQTVNLENDQVVTYYDYELQGLNVDEGGNVKADDYGAVPVYEDDRQLNISSDYANVDIEELEVGDELMYVPGGFTTKILRMANSYAVIENDMGQEVKISFAELESDDYKKAVGYDIGTSEDVNLSGIVKNVLEAYPGELNSIIDDEMDEIDYEDEQEYEQERISKDINDDELGYRFD